MRVFLCRMLSARVPRWCVCRSPVTCFRLWCAWLWCVVSAHMSATRCRVPMPYPTDASHTCAGGVPLSGVGCLVALLPSTPMTDRMCGCYRPKGARIRPTRLARPTSGAGRGRVPMGGDPHHPEFTDPLKFHPMFFLIFCVAVYICRNY